MAEIPLASAPRLSLLPSRARVVDTGRIITVGGISSGMELGFYLVERHGYDDGFVAEVARIMEYQRQWELMRGNRCVRAVAEVRS